MGVKGKKVRFCGLETIAPHETEKVGRAVLARFNLQTALSYQSIAVLYGSSQNDDHARLIARFMEETGFCEIRQKQFSQSKSMEVILNPKWPSWEEAYTSWNKAWQEATAVNAKPKKIPVNTKKAAILEVIKGQGEATLETISHHLKAAKVEIDLAELIKLIDLLVVRGKVALIEKQRSTFYGPIVKQEKSKEESGPKPLHQQINILNARISKAKKRRDDLLEKVSILNEEIDRLSSDMNILREAEKANKQLLKDLKREAKQYQAAVRHPRTKVLGLLGKGTSLRA